MGYMEDAVNSNSFIVSLKECVSLGDLAQVRELSSSVDPYDDGVNLVQVDKNLREARRSSDSMMSYDTADYLEDQRKMNRFRKELCREAIRVLEENNLDELVSFYKGKLSELEKWVKD